jgi:hypothetical protein
MGQREDQILREVVSALSIAMVTIVRALVAQTEKSGHPISAQPIITSLKRVGSSSSNFSHDPEARTMQLTILKNIADGLENERFRPEPIPLPNGL